ncbi:MAG: hypothetical protein LBR91_01730 [Puniceicoccales bacterium]|jgi:hypothetical protein|nr:hypothetical protein [Puniceicoccales bacterium]
MDSHGKNKNSPKNAQKYAMDFGIVNISKLATDGKSMHLPGSASVDPCEGKIDEKLKKVLKIETLNGSMYLFLKPDITDRSILTPQKFRLKIQQVCNVFSDKIVREGKNCLYKELLDDVITLLKSEEEKCELLDQYRHVLVMG